jgi:hypothetical protein
MENLPDEGFALGLALGYVRARRLLETLLGVDYERLFVLAYPGQIDSVFPLR